MQIDECQEAFEAWVNTSQGYGLAFARECWQAAWKAAKQQPERPLPSPVRYTDGTVSREYDEQPEPVGDGLAEAVRQAIVSYEMLNCETGETAIDCYGAAREAIAIAQAPLRQQLHQIDQAATDLITAIGMGWDLEEYVLKLQDVLPGYQQRTRDRETV